MEEKKIFEALNIRYVDLRFVLEFPLESFLPRHKASALRGGMGQALLAQNCIADGNCEKCEFSTECPVSHMMYAKCEIPTRFGGQGESMGYVIECENQKEHFYSGEHLEFHLLLYGKAIVWFAQFLQAFNLLGHMGLGKEKAQFWIILVENERGDCVMENNHVHMDNLGTATIRAYAETRRKDLQQTGFNNTLEFLSPVTLKYQGEFLQEFQSEALIRSILRRVYSFDCFEGLDTGLMMWDQRLPEIVNQNSRRQSIQRYSSTQDSKMILTGIIGSVTFDQMPEELILLFAAGEKLHIGKNTSFGFGKYVMK